MNLILAKQELGGDGMPPVVILPGLMSSARNWLLSGREIARVSGRRVLVFDPRNHGRSPHSAVHTYAAMTGDTLATLDAAGIEKAVLLGHSMGGKTAMRFAALHPERCAGLVLVDIAPRVYAFASRKAELDALAALPLERLATRREADEALAASVPSWGLRQFFLTSLVRDGDSGPWHWQVNLPVLRASIAELAASPLMPEGNSSHGGPVLLVAGGRSDHVTPEDEALMRRLFPAIRIERIAGAGHTPHIEKPEAFLEALGAWFGRSGEGAADGEASPAIPKPG